MGQSLGDLIPKSHVFFPFCQSELLDELLRKQEACGTRMGRSQNGTASVVQQE